MLKFQNKTEVTHPEKQLTSFRLFAYYYVNVSERYLSKTLPLFVQWNPLNIHTALYFVLAWLYYQYSCRDIYVHVVHYCFIRIDSPAPVKYSWGTWVKLSGSDISRDSTRRETCVRFWAVLLTTLRQLTYPVNNTQTTSYVTFNFESFVIVNLGNIEKPSYKHLCKTTAYLIIWR